MAIFVSKYTTSGCQVLMKYEISILATECDYDGYGKKYLSGENLEAGQTAYAEQGVLVKSHNKYKVAADRTKLAERTSAEHMMPIRPCFSGCQRRGEEYSVYIWGRLYVLANTMDGPTVWLVCHTLWSGEMCGLLAQHDKSFYSVDEPRGRATTNL